MNDFNFLNLTASVRRIMAEEINLDIKKGNLYISERLNSAGKGRYPELLLKAVGNGTENSLANSLHGLLRETENVQGRTKKIPKDAAEVLAQSEFNRYYIRAVCVESISNGNGMVEIYRARTSGRPRSESESKIGEKIDAQKLLADLRRNVGASPEIIPEINSGLSAKLMEG